MYVQQNCRSEVQVLKPLLRAFRTWSSRVHLHGSIDLQDVQGGAVDNHGRQVNQHYLKFLPVCKVSMWSIPLLPTYLTYRASRILVCGR